MKIVWDKWLYYNADMLMRHVGTAGMVWLSQIVANGQPFTWRSLWTSLLAGAILPVVFTILQKGLPKDEDEKPSS